MSKRRRARRTVPPPRPAAPTMWTRVLASPWWVAGTVLAVYALWMIVYVPRTHGGLDLLFVGQQFQHSHASAAITFDPVYLATRDPVGYDGQFYYYIAADPVNALHYVDAPAYRYTRVVYPLTARFLAFGQTALIPYTLLLVNLLAVAGGTLAVAAWLARAGRSPWFALAYGVYPGLFVATTLDLTEPLAYALVALAVYLYYFGGRRRILWAGLLFGLAGITREISIIFPIFYSLARLLAQGSARSWPARLLANWRPGGLLLALSTLPLVLYKIFLTRWLGTSGVTDYSILQLPFHGLLSLMPWQAWHIKEIWGVILPAFVLLVMALWALWRRIWAVEVWILLAHIEVCVVGLTSASYDAFMAPARIATGVVLAALLCIPHFDRLSRGPNVLLTRALWLAPCILLWSLLGLDWLATLSRIFPA